MYTWKGITKITPEEAIRRCLDKKEVYLLYDDETECLANSIEEIENHRAAYGEFGYENNLDTDTNDVSCCNCGRIISMESSEKAEISVLTNWRCNHC